ncbi:hypothetical protein VTK73DRAFT_4645 [Phialemonium thermophilum]|uniref:Methyltransferase type 11 domain-containing protein n=1 Tax=Phialemonium thermophilum TaxID=223376 RepID=A0ABR3V722_9PEZI
MPWNLRRRWNSYTDPIQPIKYGIRTFSATFVATLRAEGLLRTLLALPRVRDEAFARFYRELGIHFAQYESQQTPVPALVASASGTVLELGAGNGNQLAYLDAAKITRVYGIEPNPSLAADLHARLEKRVNPALREKYTLLPPCRVEDVDVLERHGVVEASVDTVVCMQVLCSATQPEAVARAAYRLLKPGGRLVFWEHHISHDWLTRLVQLLWNPLWRLAVGGCDMRKDVVGILEQAGEWEGFETLESSEEPWTMKPRISGALTKPKSYRTY